MSIPSTRYLLLGALALAGLFSGCESTVEDLRQQVTGDYPVQTHTFAADEASTFGAARQALKEMDFRFTHGGRHQGLMEAVSEIVPGEDPGSSQQYTLKADFQPSVDGKGTDVTVRMSQIVEEDSEHHRGQGVETPLRDTALYDTFFSAIDRHLALASAPSPSPPAPRSDPTSP